MGPKLVVCFLSRLMATLEGAGSIHASIMNRLIMKENMTQMKGTTSSVASLGHRSCHELSALANRAGRSGSQIVAMMLRDHARGVLFVSSDASSTAGTQSRLKRLDCGSDH